MQIQSQQTYRQPQGTTTTTCLRFGKIELTFSNPESGLDKMVIGDNQILPVWQTADSLAEAVHVKLTQENAPTHNDTSLSPDLEKIGDAFTLLVSANYPNNEGGSDWGRWQACPRQYPGPLNKAVSLSIDKLRPLMIALADRLHNLDGIEVHLDTDNKDDKPQAPNMAKALVRGLIAQHIIAKAAFADAVDSMDKFLESMKPHKKVKRS
jgi:hypothetical protein